MVFIDLDLIRNEWQSLKWKYSCRVNQNNFQHFGGKEVTIDAPNFVWPIVATVSIGSLFYFDSNLARFAFSFILTLVGAQLTHATETYVNHVDRLTHLEHKEPTNYPLLNKTHTVTQWVPILVMVIFAYSRYSLVLNQTSLNLTSKSSTKRRFAKSNVVQIFL